MAAPGRDKFVVLWADSAEQDLSSIVDYIAADSAEKAGAVLRQIRKTAVKLDRFPARGRIVPELLEQRVDLYRELIAGPWRIIYRIAGRSVLVLAVIDARRNVEDLLLDRLIRK